MRFSGETGGKSGLNLDRAIRSGTPLPRNSSRLHWGDWGDWGTPYSCASPAPQYCFSNGETGEDSHLYHRRPLLAPLLAGSQLHDLLVVIPDHAVQSIERRLCVVVDVT
jgi:hypothetical protein